MFRSKKEQMPAAELLRLVLPQPHRCHGCRADHHVIPMTAPTTSSGRSLFKCACGASLSADIGRTANGR